MDWGLFSGFCKQREVLRVARFFDFFVSMIGMQNKYLSETNYTLLSITTSTISYLGLSVGNQLYLSILYHFVLELLNIQ